MWSKALVPNDEFIEDDRLFIPDDGEPSLVPMPWYEEGGPAEVDCMGSAVSAEGEERRVAEARAGEPNRDPKALAASTEGLAGGEIG